MHNNGLISLLDVITGAFGAVILLFAITPKGTGDTLPRTTVDATLILEKNSTITSLQLPDSLHQTIHYGDTIQMVVKDSMYRAPCPNTSGSGPTPPIPPTPPTHCTLAATISKIACKDKGTPSPDDDELTFNLVVKGGQRGENWVGTIGNLQLTGMYDITVPVGPLPASKIHTLKVWDEKKHSKCVYQTEVNSAPCSVQPPTPSDPHGLTKIPGNLVILLNWVGGRENDLNLQVKKKKGNIYIKRDGDTQGNKNDLFRHFTDRGSYEYVRDQGSVKGQTYSINVALGSIATASSVNGTLTIIARDDQGKTSDTKTIALTVNSTRWQKKGQFTVDNTGKIQFNQ
jgi:hypothetical protein